MQWTNLYTILSEKKNVKHTYNLSFFDDWNHITRGEPHLVRPHQQFKGVLVHPHGGLVLLNHFYTVSGTIGTEDKLYITILVYLSLKLKFNSTISHED